MRLAFVLLTRHSRQLSTRRLRLDVQLAYYLERWLRRNAGSYVVWFVCVREKLTITTTTTAVTTTRAAK